MATPGCRRGQGRVISQMRCLQSAKSESPGKGAAEPLAADTAVAGLGVLSCRRGSGYPKTASATVSNPVSCPFHLQAFHPGGSFIRGFSLSRTCFSPFCSNKSDFSFKPYGRYHFLREAFANSSTLVQTLLCFPTHTTLCFKADLLLGHAYLNCEFRRPGNISVLCSSLSSIIPGTQ